MPKRVLFVGHGRHGKDTACETLAQATGWKNAGTTSVYLTELVVAELRRVGIYARPEDAYAERHQNRDLWRRVGDEARSQNQAFLVKAALCCGQITGGCRDWPEICAVRAESLVDLIVWVDASKRLPLDPTMSFGPEQADLIVDNNGSIGDFKLHIQRLGAALL